MEGSHIVLLVSLAVLLILSALFSATETAITGINVIRIQQLAKTGNKKAEFIYECTQSITRCITSILIVNNVVNILASALTAALFTQLFGIYGVAYATIIMTILILIFGEITPKIIARQNSEKVALYLADLLRVILFICYPFAILVEKFQNRFLKQDAMVTATEDELLAIVSTIEQEGVLEQEERELIENVIEFNDTSVKQIMVEKQNVVTIYDNISFSDLKKVLKHEKYSRIPVLSYETQKVIGILKSKDVFDRLLENEPIVIKELMKKPIFVSRRKKLPAILESIQKSREHIAIVVENMRTNEYIGIVTLEDILEELVGEIYDEHDLLPKDVVEIGHHTFIISGEVSLKDFADQNEDFKLPETNQRTFSEWIYELSGNKKIRKNKEIVYENYFITILETEEGLATKIELEINSVQK